MTLAEQIELACLMEATARKPGNIHPAAAFDDLCYGDFVRAAKAISQPLAHSGQYGLGRSIFDAVQVTRSATGTNVNLGIVLLLAPLAAVPMDVPLVQGLPTLLQQTTVDDCQRMYAAIRLAQPGGLGKSTDQDIDQVPTVTLQQAMALAASRDQIAAQYANNFAQVFAARQKLCELSVEWNDWEHAIISLQIWMMAQWPDTLIARKCGAELAAESARRAADLLSATNDRPLTDLGKVEEFDRWLRADGHRRNPGTTADLIAAALFGALRDGLVSATTRDAVEQRANEIRSAH